MCQNAALCGNGLTLPQKRSCFYCLPYKSKENTGGKEEIARKSLCYPFWKLSAIFIKLKIVVCKLLQFGRV